MAELARTRDEDEEAEETARRDAGESDRAARDSGAAKRGEEDERKAPAAGRGAGWRAGMGVELARSKSGVR